MMVNLDPSELARQLAARRRPKEVTCPICGTRAVGVGRRLYCSAQCAKRAWWHRHRSKAARLAAKAQAHEQAQDVAALNTWADDGGVTGAAE
jgi:hypothetical protein